MSAVVARGEAVEIRPLDAADQDAYLAMVAESRELHHPWVAPAADSAAFSRLRARCGEDFCSLVGWRRADGLLVGVVNVSQIVRANFQSAYCGFYASAAAAGQGLMRETLDLALDYVFSSLALHRLEANVQPSNARSLALVRRVGFRHEGFSPRYLYLDGAWRDHERFAITSEEWAARRHGA